LDNMGNNLFISIVSKFMWFEIFTWI
jgi:hypothetical protein